MENINRGRIEYTVGYRLDSQGLASLKSALEQLKSVANDIHSPLAEKGDTQQSVKNIQQLIDMANQLEAILNKSYNVKLGTYSINLFNKELKNSRLSMTDVQNTLKKMGAAGDEVGLKLAKQFTQVELKATRANNIFSTMGDTLRRTLTWNISSSVINTLTGKIQESYGYIKNLDSSLNDIRIVTSKSADEMDKFVEKANKAAKALGKSTTDYTNASLIYYQQGLSDEETAARTDVTLKAANVTQQSTAEVSEQLTAVWNGYKVSANEAELYVDKLAAVAAATASDLEELSTGMSKVASAANLVGMDVDQMNAALATTISVTRQAPETVGTAYKTILARMTTIAAGGEDEGATLKSYTKDMNEFGINVLDSTGHLRDMGEVIEEVGAKWSTMSKEAQISLAQTMAGTRQYNNLTALFDNWDMYLDALETSQEAEGTLEKQQSIYMESTAAHLQQLRTAAEGIYDSLLKPEDINDTADALTSIVTQIEKIIDSMGGLKGVLPVVLAMFSQLLSKNIGQAAGDFSNWINANKRNERQISEAKNTLDTKAFENIGISTDSYLQNTEALIGSRNTMSVEEFNQLKQSIDENADAISKFGKDTEVAKKQFEELQEKTKQGIDIDKLENNTEYFNPSQSIDKEVLLQGSEEEQVEAFDEANRFVETLRQVNEEQADDLKASITKLKELSEARKAELEAQKQSNIQEAENQKSLIENEKKSLTSALDQKKRSRSGTKGQLTRVQNALELPENNSPEKQQELAKKAEKYKEKIQQLDTEINSLTQITSELIEDYDKQIEKIDQETEKENEKIEEQFKSNEGEELAEALTEYEELMNKIGNSSKEVSELLDNIKKGEELTAEEAENLNKQLNEQADIMEDKSAEDFLSGITSVGAGIASVVTGLMTLSETMDNIWSNDDLTFWEKFGQTILTVGTSVGVVVSGFSSLSKGLELIDASFKAGQAAIDNRTVALRIQQRQQESSTGANIAQAATSEEVARASREAARATNEETKADREQAAASVSAAEGNTAQATASRGGILSGIGKKVTDAAKNAGSVLTKFGNITGGTTVLGNITGLAAGIATLTALAAAIAAWTWAINEINKAWNDTKMAVEEANKSYEEQKNLLASLKENQDSFNDSLERITEQKNSMESLVKGTEEYNETLKKTSEEIENLIEKFPELKEKAKFEKGAWSISDEDLQKFKEKYEKQVNIAKVGTYEAENSLQQAELNDSRKNLQSEYFLPFWSVRDSNTKQSLSKGDATDYFLSRSTEDIESYLAALKTSTSLEEKDKIFNSFKAESGDYRNFLNYQIKTLNDRADVVYSEEGAEKFESFLQTIIDLQNQQLEVERLAYENNKASIDTMYSENIAELLRGKDEDTAEMIANAVEGKNASYLEGLIEVYKWQMTKDHKGTEFTSENSLAAQDYLRQSYMDKYGLEASDVNVKSKGNNFVISFPDSDIEEIELSQEQVINQFAAYMAANSEEMKESVELWTKRTAENEEAALAYWVAEDSTRVENLSLSQLEALSSLDENNEVVQAILSEIGTTVEDIKGYVEIGTEAEEARKGNLVSASGKQAYQAASQVDGFEDLTGEQRDALVEKINSIYAENGKTGIESFIKSLESIEDISLAFDFNLDEQIDGLSEDLSKRLKTLKIDKSVFDNYKEQFIQKFGEASDESIVRWLESQKLFNNIEKDFDNIFDSLSDVTSETLLNPDQIDNLVEVQGAFETLSGLDLDQQWILDNIDLLKSYVKGSEEAAQELTSAFNAIRAEQHSTLKIFANYSDTVEGKVSEGLVDNLKKAGYTEEEIDNLLLANGYSKNEDGSYYKDVILSTVLNGNISSAEDKTVSLAKMSQIMEETDIAREELEKNGWYLDTTGGSIPVWRNTDKDITLGQSISFILDAGMTDKLAGMSGNKTISQDGLDTLGKKYLITEDDIKQFCSDLEIPFKKDVENGHVTYHLGDFTVEQLVEWKTLGTVTDESGEDILGNIGDNFKKETAEKTYTKIERNTEFDINYDSWDKLISYKEKELDRLEEAAEDLTGDALLQNLEERKKIYDEINEQREQELKQNELDIETFKKQVEALGAEIDPETGYILNERDLKKGWSDSKNAIADQFNQYINEDGSLTEAGQALGDEEIKKINKSYTNYKKTVEENKQAIENYNTALEKNIELLEDSNESLKSRAELQATQDILKVTNAYEQFSVDAAAAEEEVSKFENLLSDDKAVNERIADLAELGKKQKEELTAYESQLQGAQKTEEDLLNTLKDKNIKIDLTGNIAQDTKTIEDEISSIGVEISNVEKKIENASGDEKKQLEATLLQLLEKKEYLDQFADQWETINNDIEDTKKKIQDVNDALSTSVEEMQELSDWQTGSVDKQLETVERTLSRLQRRESRLTGQNLVNNLNKQKAIIQQQIKLEQNKLKILRQQLKTLQEQLRESLKQILVDQKISVKFEQDGSVNTTSLWNSLNANKDQISDEIRQEIVSLVNDINSKTSEINSLEDSIFGHQEDLKDMQDKIKDAVEEAAKKAMDRALEIFNAKVDFEVNIEDAWRQFDRLEAKVNGLREKSTELFQNALLDYSDAIRYVTANINSYFGEAGGGSVQILTQHVNDIMSEISVMQSGGKSSLYGIDQTTAFSDLENYYGQLMSAVEGFYDAIDSAKEKYGEAIDAIISKNEELLNDFEKIKSLQDHGISLTKLLYGEESFAQQQDYLDKQADVIQQQLEASIQQRDYYKNLLASLSPDDDNYDKVKQAYLDAMKEVYSYTEDRLNKLHDALMNQIDAQGAAIRDNLAAAAGFGSNGQMDRDWEYQTQLDEDYLDATNTQYEIDSLTNKFNEAISDTDSLAAKEKLTDVMKEQLDILNEQLEKGQKLTKYDIERANKVYELTLKQIALEEAQENKSKMRLRRDSQGNYRYEYVADQDKINKAKQDLLDAENDLYNFDKNRAKEMINSLNELLTEYHEKQKEITEDLELTEEERDAALLELQERYWGKQGLITMAKDEYLQASERMKEESVDDFSAYDDTLAASLATNWDSITQAVSENTILLQEKARDTSEAIKETLDATTTGAEDLEGAINAGTEAMAGLIEQDEELIDQYGEQIEAIQDLLLELESLEAQYRAVMDAALAAVDAALKLRQTSWETEEDEKEKEKAKENDNDIDLNGNLSGNGGSSKDRYADVYVSEDGFWAVANPAYNKKDLGVAIGKQFPSVQKILWESWNNEKARINNYKKKTIKYDTGGYTGAWGSEGKIAMLHEKELILNKVDTANILQAVDIVRTLSSDLAVLQNAAAANSSNALMGSTSKETIEQNVKIEANFPNVTNSNEIEQAFNNLVNLASQRAMRK